MPDAEYAPCPKCGERSLASLVDHICEDCADTYIYCVRCANPEQIDGSQHWLNVEGNCDRCGQHEPPEGSECPARIDGGQADG